MKRFLCLLLVLLILLFCACGETTEKEKKDIWKPDVASEDVEPYAEQAIKIIDQYLNFEIDDNEVDEKISSIYSRISKLNIEDNTRKYNGADETILSKIELLNEYNIKYQSDIQLQQTQDILRIQIGKKAKEDVYNYRDFSFCRNEDDLCGFIDFDSIPANSISIFESDEGYTAILLFFDYMYGISPQNVLKHIEDLFSIATNEGVKVSITAYYGYYEQLVFHTRLMSDGNNGASGYINIFSDATGQMKAEKNIYSVDEYRKSFKKLFGNIDFE